MIFPSNIRTRGLGLTMFVVLIGALLLTACDALLAPADLDVTPSPAPTDTPMPTATPDAAVDASNASTSSADQAVLDAILAAVPSQIPAGAIIWRRDLQRDMQAVTNVQNGIGMKVFFNEQTGGTSTLTFAVFNAPEDAAVYYEFIQGLRSVLANGRPLENLPQPNLAGSGLYGSNAIFQLDNIFVEVSVELFSSTQGNPIPSLSQQAINIVQTGLSTASADAPAGGEATTEATDEAAGGGNQAVVESILGALPPLLRTSVEWRLDSASQPEYNSIDDNPNGVTGSIHYTTTAPADAFIFVSVLDDSDRAQEFFDTQHQLHETLRAANPSDQFPEPNLFAGGTYGWAALQRIDNVVIRLSVPRFPSTMGDPLPSLMRQVISAVESANAEAST
jgi:hypothetical protein